MGRTQISQSTQSRVQSAAAASGKSFQAKLHQAQPQQQQRPVSSKVHPNAQVYRPTPVNEHPDDAFVTGAWLFDQSRVPQWMQSQLPSHSTKAQVRSTTMPKQNQGVKQQQVQRPQTSQRNQSPTSHTHAQLKPMVQQHRQQVSSKMMRSKPVYEHPDTAFFSGAWLFDTARTPLWMQREVPAVATALVVRSRRLAKALPFGRTQRHVSKTTTVPLRHAFGATPHAVIPCGSVKARRAHPDDAFYSGAWMFDVKCAPSWLVQELGSNKNKQQAVHVQKQKTTHTQVAGVKLMSGRKLGV